MKRNKIGKYSEKGHLAYVTQNILELIEKRKIKLAKQIIFDELKKFPNDECLNKHLAYCYFLEKNYEAMLKVSKELKEEKEFLNITIAAIKLEDEEKLRYLYETYYYDYCLPIKLEYSKGDIYRLYRCYLMKRFEPHLELDTFKMTYKERQVWQYSPENALDYIKKNYGGNIQRRDVAFYPNIDLDELFEFATESIEYNKGRESCGRLGESYIFSYPGCGITSDGKECDYLIVSTSFNSNNVFSMHPATSLNLEYYPELSEFIHTKTQTKSSKVKAKSGLERFKSKYNF